MPVGGANSIITGLRAVGGKPRLTLTVASDSTMKVPHGNDSFYVSGSGTVNFLYGGIRPGRIVKLIGASGTTAVLTDTAIASSADGRIHLTGGNFTFADGRYVLLEQRENGSWIGVDQQAID